MFKGKTMTARQEKWCFIIGLVVLFAGLVCTVVLPYIIDNSVFIQLGAAMFLAGLICVVLMKGKRDKRTRNSPPPPRQPSRPRFKN